MASVQVTKLKILLNPFAKGFRDNDGDTDWFVYAVPTAAATHCLQTLPFTMNMGRPMANHALPTCTNGHL